MFIFNIGNLKIMFLTAVFYIEKLFLRLGIVYKPKTLKLVIFKKMIIIYPLVHHFKRIFTAVTAVIEFIGTGTLIYLYLKKLFHIKL